MIFLDNVCSDIGPLISFIKAIIKLIQYAVPVAIIILGSVDLFKAVIASKEDEIKAAQKILIKRIIYGVVIFFLAAIVTLVFNTLAKNQTAVDGGSDFMSCWNSK